MSSTKARSRKPVSRWHYRVTYEGHDGQMRVMTSAPLTYEEAATKANEQRHMGHKAVVLNGWDEAMGEMTITPGVELAKKGSR